MTLMARKLLLHSDPKLIYESASAGTVQVPLAAGRYEITLIGGGSGAAAGVGSGYTGTAIVRGAQGGVGGTLQFSALLLAATTVNVTVGAGGASQTVNFNNPGYSATGSNGNASTITGFPNLSASAGGASGATFSSTSASSGNASVGSMGTNSVSGSALITVIMNNPNYITGNQLTSATGRDDSNDTHTAARVLNTNWPANTQYGAGGDIGWNSSHSINARLAGGVGYVRIIKL